MITDLTILLASRRLRGAIRDAEPQLPVGAEELEPTCQSTWIPPALFPDVGAPGPRRASSLSRPKSRSIRPSRARSQRADPGIAFPRRGLELGASMSVNSTNTLSKEIVMSLREYNLARGRRCDRPFGPGVGAVEDGCGEWTDQRRRVDQRRRQRADCGGPAEDRFGRRRQLRYRDAERRKQRGCHPGTEVDRRLAASHADNGEEAVKFRFQKITTPGTIRRPIALALSGAPQPAPSLGRASCGWRRTSP